MKIAHCHNCHKITYHRRTRGRWSCTNCLIVVETIQPSLYQDL